MSIFQRMTSVAIVLSGLLLGTAVPVVADEREECKKETQKAEKELYRAIEKHGEASREADFRRQELDEIRDRCRTDHERREELKQERRDLHEELEHEHGNY
jgi:hypothetical protein